MKGQVGYARILLATDGSEPAEAAVDEAIKFAHVSSGAVRVVHVWNLEVHHRHGYWDVEVRSEAEQLVESTVTRLKAAGVTADQAIVRADTGHVAAAVAIAARDFAADLVIVGSRGLSDWQAIRQHSVTHHLLTTLDCPLLVVRGKASPGEPQRVLLAIAGGDDITPGVQAAIGAAAAPGSKVMVVHVAQVIVGVQGFTYVEPEEEVAAAMAKAIKLLSDAGVPAEAVVAESGPVAETLARMADTWEADLIVTGSSRMGDVASMVLGSVSHQLLHSTERPVLIAGRMS
jgi:nucleotide-binding universal stress UspA family protein